MERAAPRESCVEHQPRMCSDFGDAPRLFGPTPQRIGQSSGITGRDRYAAAMLPHQPTNFPVSIADHYDRLAGSRDSVEFARDDKALKPRMK